MSVQYLFLMVVIYMLLRTFSDRLGISVPGLIFRIFDMKKRAHLLCLNFRDSIPAVIMVGSTFTIV